MAFSIRRASYYYTTVKSGGPGEAYRLPAQGDDELGALNGVHSKIPEAAVAVCASTGVTDGRGSFGYIVYVRPEDADRAAEALGI